MKNKRLKLLFKKNFKEEISEYLPGTKVYGLPNDYSLRILYILLMYGFYSLMGIGAFSFLAFFYLGKNDEFSYFLISSLTISIFVVIGCAIDLISDYSKSKDIDILMAMPIRDEEIYMSKFLAIILSKFEIFYFYFLMVCVYLFNMGFSFIRFFGLIINVFPIFLISLALISFPVMLIMRFSNIRAYKTSLKFIGYGFLLFGIAFVYFSLYTKDGRSNELISKLMKLFVKYSGKISFLFFHTRIYAKSLSGNGLDFILYTFLLYLYAIFILFLLSKLASKIYLDSLRGNEQRKSHKKSENISYKKSSVIIAIFKKDFKDLIKSPVYLFPILSSMIMFAFLFGFGSFRFIDLIRNMDYQNKESYILIFLGAFAFRFLISGNDVGINSSLSREGESLYQTLTLPISPKDNILARALSINFVSLIMNLLFCLVLSFITKINILAIFSIFAGFFMASLVSSFQGLLMDTNSINIHWEKERELTKGSSKNIGYFLIEGFVLLIVGVVSYLIYKFTNIYIGFLFVILVIIGAIIFLYRKVLQKYERGFFDI